MLVAELVDVGKWDAAEAILQHAVSINQVTWIQTFSARTNTLGKIFFPPTYWGKKLFSPNMLVFELLGLKKTKAFHTAKRHPQILIVKTLPLMT